MSSARGTSGPASAAEPWAPVRPFAAAPVRRRHDVRAAADEPSPVIRAPAALRLVGRRVETAVWTLVHPVTGRTVTLVGTMHVGTAEYFRSLSTLLGRLSAAGAEIHVEGISGGGDEVDERARARLAEADGWASPETTGAVVAVLGVESQDRLRLPEGFRNVDLTRAELLRRVGWNAYRHLLAPGPSRPPPATLGPVVRAAMRFELRHHRAIERLRNLRPCNRRVSRVVIEDRNRVAFAGATASLASGDVALVWGTEHLPGLALLFGEAGYRPARRRWVEACAV